MGVNRDHALEECQPEMELAFSLGEFEHRLQRTEIGAVAKKVCRERVPEFVG